VSCVDYDAVGESSQFMLFSFLGFSARRGSDDVEVIRVSLDYSRSRGVVPRPQGSHTNPGAAFVQDSVRDNGLSLRSTQASRSPGGPSDHPTLQPVAPRPPV